MKIEELNHLSSAEAETLFLRCCGSRTWAVNMSAGRPYPDIAAVRDRAVVEWDRLPEPDRMEAFTAHPRIGDVESLRKKFADTKAWASGEQSGVQDAPEDIIRGLARGNHAYEEKFGFVFIVCATGRSAPEMLSLLEARLINTREQEIRNASAEQIRISLIRIDKWLAA